jgi:hypothetical protein
LVGLAAAALLAAPSSLLAQPAIPPEVWANAAKKSPRIKSWLARLNEIET